MQLLLINILGSPVRPVGVRTTVSWPDPLDDKECTCCGHTKLLSEFRIRSKNHYRNVCKSCEKANAS